MKSIVLAVLLSLSFSVAHSEPVENCNSEVLEYVELQAKYNKLKKMYLKVKDDLEMETLELNLINEAYYGLVEKNKSKKN